MMKSVLIISLFMRSNGGFLTRFPNKFEQFTNKFTIVSDPFPNMISSLAALSEHGNSVILAILMTL